MSLFYFRGKIKWRRCCWFPVSCSVWNTQFSKTISNKTTPRCFIPSCPSNINLCLLYSPNVLNNTGKCIILTNECSCLCVFCVTTGMVRLSSPAAAPETNFDLHWRMHATTNIDQHPLKFHRKALHLNKDLLFPFVDFGIKIVLKFFIFVLTHVNYIFYRKT